MYTFIKICRIIADASSQGQVRQKVVSSLARLVKKLLVVLQGSKKLPLDVMLQVGTWVATEKLKSSGARSGLPFYEDLISKFYFFSEEKTKIFPKCSFVAEYKI